MSLNLNALFNPQGYSCILNDLPLYGTEQYEGFVYLGAGGILLLLALIILLPFCIKYKGILSRYYSEIIGIILVLSFALITALSPTVSAGSSVLFNFSLPGFIEKYWGAFRATGRVGWIIFYMLLMCSCIVLCKVFKNRVAMVILTLGTVEKLSLKV